MCLLDDADDRGQGEGRAVPEAADAERGVIEVSGVWGWASKGSARR